MIRCLIVIAVLAMGCAVAPACNAQASSVGGFTASSTTQQIDPVRRQWLEHAVNHILSDDGGRSDAR